MQIQINKFLVLLMAIVLLGTAGCETNTSQNNGMGSNNQNTPNSNNPGQNPDGDRPTVDPCTGGIDKAEIIEAIKSDLPVLMNQFKEINSASGTVSLDYAAANQELIFKGYITGGEKELRAFFKRFDELKKKDCVKIVTFQGDGIPNFELRLPAPTTTPPASCSVDIDDVLDKSGLKKQHKVNFEYSLDEMKVLTFTGKFYDEKGHVKDLFLNLKDLSNGCISKIVLAGQNGTGGKPMVAQGFSWMVCQGTQIECNGECVPGPNCGSLVPSPTRPSNTNTNTNTNINR